MTAQEMQEVTDPERTESQSEQSQPAEEPRTTESAASEKPFKAKKNHKFSRSVQYLRSQGAGAYWPLIKSDVEHGWVRLHQKTREVTLSMFISPQSKSRTTIKMDMQDVKRLHKALGECIEDSKQSQKLRPAKVVTPADDEDSV